jgi:hypothetical protein
MQAKAPTLLAFGQLPPAERKALLELAEIRGPLVDTIPKNLARHWPKALAYAATGVAMGIMGLFLHLASYVPIVTAPLGVLLHVHGTYVGLDMILREAPKALKQVRFPVKPGGYLDPLALLAKKQYVYPQLLQKHEKLTQLLEKYTTQAPEALVTPPENAPKWHPTKDNVVAWLTNYHDAVARGLELMEHETAGVSQKFPHLLVATKPQAARFIGSSYPQLTRIEKFAHLFYDFPFPVGKLLNKIFKEGPNGRAHVSDVPRLVETRVQALHDQEPNLDFRNAHAWLKANDGDYAHGLAELGKGFKNQGIEVNI